jgi:peroxiredoxin (alkyl hydroperoxide reductase subunit C)
MAATKFFILKSAALKTPISSSKNFSRIRGCYEEVSKMKKFLMIDIVPALILLLFVATAFAGSEAFKDNIYNPGQLKPVDSTLKVKIGEPAPDFTLPSVSGEKVSLSQYRGKKHVVLSFVPAAWTPVCSDQWPGYNIVKQMFDENDAVLLGITVDNIPTLYAWTKQMGNLWFPVLSDFWPHGAVAEKYGVLRSSGVSERALIFIDKKGIIQDIQVSDINVRPDLAQCATTLQKMNKK